MISLIRISIVGTIAYLAIMVLGPIFGAIAIGLTLWIGAKIADHYDGKEFEAAVAAHFEWVAEQEKRNGSILDRYREFQSDTHN